MKAVGTCITAMQCESCQNNGSGGNDIGKELTRLVAVQSHLLGTCLKLEPRGFLSFSSPKQSESPLIPTLYSSLSSLHSTLTLQSWHLGALSTSVVCLQLLCLRPARPQLLRLCQIPRQSVCQHVKSSQRGPQERVESRLQGSVQSRLPKRLQSRFLGKVQKSQPLQR